MSTLGSGESRRRAEIEAKRAKLAELKRAREERTSRLLASRPESRAGALTPGGSHFGSASGAGGGDGSSSAGTGGGGAGTPASSRKDLDDFVATLVGSSTGAAAGRSSISGSGRGGPPGTGGLISPGGHASPRKSYASTGSEFGGDSESAGPSGYGTTLISRSNGETMEDTVYMRPPPELVEAEQELFELPPRERVYYTKEVQTTATSTADDLEATGGVGTEIRIGPDGKLQGLSAEQEQLIRAKILADREREERERAEEARLKKEEEDLEKEIEEDIRVYTQEELEAVYKSPEFAKFLENTNKIAARAIVESNDYLKDYTKTGIAAAGETDTDQGLVHCVRTFWDEKLLKNRSVTALDWSSRHTEHCVSSYNRNPMGGEEPDGIVAVWNMELKDRPEFVFHAQTDVLSVLFSPFHPNLVIGGTYSGQILMWDTRARALPILKTPLSATGHTHPVYSMQLVGTQNAHNLVTASSDGTVCTWMLDMLAQPQESVELQNINHSRTPEVSVTSLAFPGQETNAFWVGTEEGNVYSAGRFDRAGSRAGLHSTEVYTGHAAPITGLHFHPLAGPIDFSDLFLSSSMDWTSKLWRANTQDASRPEAPAPPATSTATTTGTTATGEKEGPKVKKIPALVNFEESTDYIYDIKWHPSHPSIFGQVDGAGVFDIYDLNTDTERPISRTQVGSGRAINKLAWDRKDGKFASVGGADGRVYVYDVGELAYPPEDAWTNMQESVTRLLAPLPSSVAADPHPQQSAGAPLR